MNIGKNILKVMKEKDIDIDSLSSTTKIKYDILYDILYNKIEPLTSDLLKITTALSTDITTLLYNKSVNQKNSVKTKANERVTIKRKNNFRYESLAPNFMGRHMEPFELEVYKTNTPDFSSHEGEEFHYVINGKIKIILDKEEFILEKGDSIYFDSSIKHSVTSVCEKSKVISAIYNANSIMNVVQSKKMQDLIQAAKLLTKKSIVLISPDNTSLSAVNKAIEENIISKAYLIGSKNKIESACNKTLIHKSHYEFIYIETNDENYEKNCAEKGVETLKKYKAQMIMKGKINTAYFVKAILDKQKGLSTDRRLSLVSIFALPNLNRLIFLTDAGINPELFVKNDEKSSIDIIKNAIDVANGLGVAKPFVALLDANEMPSSKIPTTMYEHKLSTMQWENAVVYGPLSYDLALYKEAVEKKGIKNNPVAGKADILAVPHIEGGNFLYKAWAMTMGADVANIVLGAQVPIILTSRSDSNKTKFLTICASAIYSNYLESKDF